MSSDQSVGEGYEETLAIFTEAAMPSEPRTVGDVAATLGVDEPQATRFLRALVDDGELQSKEVGSAGRVWWRPASAAADSPSTEETVYFDKILSQSADYVLIVDETGRVKYNSPPVESMLGWDPDELVGSDSFSNVHPDDRSTAREVFAELLSSSVEEMVVEFRVQHADGSWRWVEATGVDKRSDPVIDGALLNVRDITARKQRELELRETTWQLQAVLDTIESAVFMKDAEGHYLLMNRTFREWVGLDPQADISGLTDEDLFDDATAAQFRADDQRAFRNQSTITVEEEVSVPNGIRTRLTRKSPLTDASGEEYAICAVSTDITEQTAREQRLEQHRSDLAALNSLNQVFREVTEAVLDQSTRSEIEEAISQQLVESDSYGAAWLGGLEPGTDTVTVRATAGLSAAIDPSITDGSLVAWSTATDAVRTDSLTVADDCCALDDCRLASCAAVPITHESTQYGVLGIATDREDAFGSHEQAVLRQLGEVVGHAIAATERQRALLSDEIIELSFEVEELFEDFEFSLETTGRISYNRSVPVRDGGFLVYGTATGDSLQLIETLVDSELAARWESVTVLSTDDGVSTFELYFTDHPVFSTLKTQAGHVHEAIVEDGTFRSTFHFAPNADIQQAIDSVKAVFPGATLVTRQRRVRPALPPQRLLTVLSDRLTERQLAALEAAYGAGFFNWPRDRSAEALADSLGIAPSTYHQHLRKAQQTLMEIVFESESG